MGESEKSEKFDGNLVFVTNDCDVRDGQFYFHNEHLGRFVPMSESLLRSLAFRHELIKHGVRGLPEEFKKWFINHELAENIAKERKDSKRLPHPEIYEILEKGRLQISLLLNSPGSYGLYLDNIKRICDYIKAKKGELSAFGSLEALSAAAFLFMHAPKGRRFLSPVSKLMFHLGSSAYGPTEDKLNSKVKRERRRKEEIEIRKLLSKNTTKRHRQKMKAILDRAFSKPETPDCPIYFSGREADELGLAQLEYGLEEKFQETHEVSRDTYKNTPIDKFFRMLNQELLKRAKESL